MTYQPTASRADDQVPEIWVLQALPTGLLAEESKRLDAELAGRREAERGRPSSRQTDELQDRASAARLIVKRREAMRRHPSGGGRRDHRAA
jgi:hypothetical protein